MLFKADKLITSTDQKKFNAKYRTFVSTCMNFQQQR